MIKLEVGKGKADATPERSATRGRPHEGSSHLKVVVHSPILSFYNTGVPYKENEEKEIVMDIATVSQLIDSVGFPIVMCGLLIYVIYDMQKRYATAINDVTAALNRNTEVMQKMLDSLEEGEKGADQ